MKLSNTGIDLNCLCPFTESNISKLEAVQRRAARWVKHDYEQTSSVTEMMQSLHWRRLDQWRIDNKLSLMYKITLNLIDIPISDFLIPLVRLSRHYHPLSYRLITATWLLQFFILSKSRILLEQPPPRNCGLLHLGAVQPSSLQDWPRLTIEYNHTFTPYLYSHLVYF